MICGCVIQCCDLRMSIDRIWDEGRSEEKEKVNIEIRVQVEVNREKQDEREVVG